jgi:hypothetical protein
MPESARRSGVDTPGRHAGRSSAWRRARGRAGRAVEAPRRATPTGGRGRWIAVAGLLLLAGLAAGATVFGAGAPSVKGWTVTIDVTGSCRVSTPPAWVAGRDFFLARESAGSDVVWSSGAGRPPTGYALWGIDRSDRSQLAALPLGTRYQLRASVRRLDLVCSVWRIKPGAEFTSAETSTMKQVAKTLQAVP